MATSQDGWPALVSGSGKLHTWNIPAKGGAFRLTMRNGSGGFILAWLALWLAETVAFGAGKTRDDWGYAWRPIRGYTTGLSNHAAGTAFDIDATRHPLGKVGTWGRKAISIRRVLAWAALRHVIRWGGDYHGRKDEMHFEIVGSLAQCEVVAKRLGNTPRGKRIREANPDQWKVVLS